MNGTRDRLASPRALIGGPAAAAIAGASLALWVLIVESGWDYYRTPLRIRGYHEAHRFLRPSGLGGHSLAIAGTLVLLSTLAYVARKKLTFLAKRGSLPRWLEVHVFFGVFGPILITLHTSFKFNGLISVAYWSMLLVMFSGFIGRSLYVRIPKTIRGNELTRAEVEERISELKLRLGATQLSEPLRAHLDQIDHPDGATAVRRWRNEAALQREIVAAGVERAIAAEILSLARERTSLMRSIARLEKRRQLFQVWHVFHRPLVWVMFLILFVHVGVAVYFGYTLFR